MEEGRVFISCLELELPRFLPPKTFTTLKPLRQFKLETGLNVSCALKWIHALDFSDFLEQIINPRLAMPKNLSVQFTERLTGCLMFSAQLGEL